MYRQGAKLVMEPKLCYSCSGSGIHPTITVPCYKCEGTGLGPRGGKKGCRSCNGYGGCNQYLRTDELGEEFGVRLRPPCTTCEGGGYVDPSLYDTLPAEVWESLDFRVIYTDRPQGGMESLIGVGCYSVTDYGDAWKARDAGALMHKVRVERESRPQAIKVARYLCPTCGEPGKPRWDFSNGYPRDPGYVEAKVAECGHPHPPQVWEDSNELVDAVVINVHPRGYTVLGVFYEDRQDFSQGPGVVADALF